MNNNLNENSIEQSFIDQLVSLGYTYFNGKDIAPNSDNPQRESFASVILEGTSENKSTSFLDDDKMKELIHTIVDVIRKNATVDWSKRDDVRAKLRLTVKKILMRYGYPPDLAKMEADRVLRQGEALAEMFSSESQLGS